MRYLVRYTYVDTVTGVYNGRAFATIEGGWTEEKVLEAEAALSADRGVPVAVLGWFPLDGEDATDA